MTTSDSQVAQPPARDRFNQMYENGTPPWVIGEPQPAVVELERTGRIRGKVLDAGCGLGEHTILLTTLGHDVLGIDYAPNAVEQATANAAAKGVDARFEVRDATRLPADGRYDTILDSALFHIFGNGVGDEDDRTRYVESLHGALKPGGYAFVLALADTGRGLGPAVSEAVVREAFSGWDLEALESTTYRGVVGEAHTEALGVPVGTVVDEPAWLARARRR